MKVHELGAVGGGGAGVVGERCGGGEVAGVDSLGIMELFFVADPVGFAFENFGTRGVGAMICPVREL
jgi:hypothetical protein